LFVFVNRHRADVADSAVRPQRQAEYSALGLALLFGLPPDDLNPDLQTL
jgi:hypothetical protein